ncbi:MAG: ATP-binding cassette domain-containing protein [Candidatus Kaistia colombiensis]|nr:MAG: ATP-binding cassette domain-containing protein [Kaistia sp.]
MTAPALELRGLSKKFPIRVGGRLLPRYAEHVAVDGVSLVVPTNRIVGLVGESGSGKTTTGLMAMRLIEPTSGQILIDGKDISRLGHAELKPFRRQMQVVFQDSYSALDPMMTLAQIVAEPLHIHGLMTARAQTEAALGWLERVGLDRSYGQRYPHELSGGQRQRVAIARALILRPSVLVADEPTSALDVSVKAQIINLLQDLQEEMGLSILFISHDLSVVRSLTDTVVVMHRGRVVEQAPTEAIFLESRHPYTRSLLDAIPVLHPRDRRRRTFQSAETIATGIPRLSARDLAAPAMPSATPQLVTVTPDHRVEAIVTA